MNFLPSFDHLELTWVFYLQTGTYTLGFLVLWLSNFGSCEPFNSWQRERKGVSCFILMVNMIVSRVTQEANLQACLWGRFQIRLIYGRWPIINVGRTIPWEGGTLPWEGCRLSANIHLSLLLNYRGHGTNCLTTCYHDPPDVIDFANCEPESTSPSFHCFGQVFSHNHKKSC